MDDISNIFENEKLGLVVAIRASNLKPFLLTTLLKNLISTRTSR
jgi:hypothetical protein